MKKAFVLCAFLCGALLTSLHATSAQQFEPATVISVESNATASSFDVSGSTDAPLRAEIHSYNIGVQQGNIVYRLSYDSAFEDVTPIFAANQPIQVSLKGNVLNVALPGSRTIPMAIENRAEIRNASHTENN